MERVITDINPTLVFSDKKAKVTNRTLNNGDVAFCSEDRSITLKYNDELYNMTNPELPVFPNSTLTTKGIVQLSDKIDSTSTTLAATANALKQVYDLANTIATKQVKGIVKLCDDIDSESNVDDGIAATPLAVKKAYDFASINATGETFGRVKLSDATNSTSYVKSGIAATPVAVKNTYDFASINANGSTYGRVRLSDATDSASSAVSTIAATPLAVKKTYDFASINANGSTSGRVKLSDAIDSESGVNDSIAATPNAVKTTYDFANTKANDYTFGIVKLSSDVNLPNNSRTSMAATPAAVKTVYDFASINGNLNTFGRVKLSDEINLGINANSSIAATPLAVKTVYDFANSLQTKANDTYTLGQELSSKITIIENTIKRYNLDIIGVACTGNGRELAWIDGNFNEIKISDGYFDEHPSYQFTERIFDNEDIVCRIPLCYWWRGIIPTGSFEGNWGMILSPSVDNINGLTFIPNYVAYTNNGKISNSFYYSKYLSRYNNDNEPTSKPDGEMCKSTVADLGDLSDYVIRYMRKRNRHIVKIQEYHEILARMIIEKKSFDLINSNDVGNYEKASYRGIMELWGVQNSDTSETGVNAEWLDGLRAQTGENKYWQYYSADISGYKNTDILSQNGYGSTLKLGNAYNNIFLMNVNSEFDDTVETPILPGIQSLNPSSADGASYVYVDGMPFNISSAVQSQQLEKIVGYRVAFKGSLTSYSVR